MKTSEKPILSPGDVVRILVSRPKRWLLPAVAITVLAGLFAVSRPATWEASQALIVRNEAANNEDGPGEFRHEDQMKTVQETIVELAKGRDVLTAALVEVGPPADCKNPHNWPSARDVADLRDAVTLTPPGGAEFGTTEVFYLSVKGHDYSRAIALADVICDRLEARFQELRDTKAQSMIDELAKTTTLTRADLADSTTRLSKIEKEVGCDLAELRVLHESGSGDSALRRTVGEIRAERREASAALQANKELLTVLRDAADDPGRLVATPNRLLQSQPALRRLKEGLVDAQLRTAQLKGRMSDEHPKVQAAKDAENEIGRHLHAELAIAVRGLEIDLRLGTDRLAMLDNQLETVNSRLARLAELRATYSNQVAETQNRSELLKQSEQNLAEARSSQASAKAASLITRIGTPDAGVDPLGPSRSMIVLLGMVGGLVAGLGVVFMTLETNDSPVAAPAPIAEKTVAEKTQQTKPVDMPRPLINNDPRPANGKANRPSPAPAGSLSLKQALQRIAQPEPAWN